MKRFECISKKPLDWFFPLISTGQTEFEPGEIIEVDNPRDVVRLTNCPDKFKFLPEEQEEDKTVKKVAEKKETVSKKTEDK